MSSCSKRNLAYFSNLQEFDIYKQEMNNRVEHKIHPDDLLSISITSLSTEANQMFNNGETPQTSTISNFSMANMSNNNILREGYLVNKNGCIDFPVLGKITVGGLTKSEVQELLINKLGNYLKEPIVNIRYLNFKVTVVGEVNHPSTFTIPSERINIVEALGMAGDMTAFGKRENVLVMREEDGNMTMTRLNLNDKNILNSPYFYLQQNDIIYVEPDKKKEIQASTDTRFWAIITASATILAALIYNWR